MKGYSNHIVLVENEVTMDGKYDFWEDSTGEQYHFPNSYINKITPGTQFIYYKGIARRDGTKGLANYFGYGEIGEVWLDPSSKGKPKKNWHWYCEIINYNEFLQSVKSKRPDGSYYEIVSSNYDWANCRNIPEQTFEQILKNGGIHSKQDSNYESIRSSSKSKKPKMVKGLLIGHNRKKKGSGSGYFFKSKQAKAIGDLAENIVMKKILEPLEDAGHISKLKLVASEYKGWDIEYIDQEGKFIAVEVKGTKSNKFQNFKVTKREWKKAEEMGANYHLYIVARCNSDNPEYEILINPSKMVNEGQAIVLATEYRFERTVN